MTGNELHESVHAILEASGYAVSMEESINGTKLDTIARRRGAPIPETLCIECTTSHVDVDVYGKNSTHFFLMREKHPQYRLILISSSGFAPLTKERAEASGVHCWTFDEFRRKFIDAASYMEFILGPSKNSPITSHATNPTLSVPFWKQLRDLESVYQEPPIAIRRGKGSEATASSLSWFDTWLKSTQKQWISLIGDYGTGKTALSKMLLLRWMKQYQADMQYLPIRIELRDFATKFDYGGLIIHFWKTHQLDSMPLKVLERLIDEGRVVFLLDGYDEMAQNLSIVDRRNCLLALTKAISGKSSGIITSRPNYFTEAEELRIVDVLYGRGQRLHRLDLDSLVAEREIDSLLQRYYIERTDALLSDLSPEQVDKLLEKQLGHDSALLQSVKNLIKNIYGLPDDEESADSSLATKPVVITYLLEIAENLTGLQLEPYQPLDDWGIYQLILDKLVVRDSGRTSGIVTQGERRQFLQKLSVELTSKRKPSADRETLINLVHSLFGRELRRSHPSEVAAQEDLYFTDLRSSASLTSTNDRWRFSHSSLREFLFAEAFIESILENPADPDEAYSSITPSQGIVRFLSAAFSHHKNLLDCLKTAASVQPETILNLLIPSLLLRHQEKTVDTLEYLIPSKKISGSIISSIQLSGLSFSEWAFDETIFDRCNFSNSNFLNCQFDSASLYDCLISGAKFTDCKFNSCTFDSVIATGAKFSRCRFSREKLVSISSDQRIVSGDEARALIRYLGGEISPNRHLNIFQFYRRWTDFEKIVEQLLKEQAMRQRLGLTNRGGINDPGWTNKLVNTLVNRGFCKEDTSRGLVGADPDRRSELAQMLEGHLPPQIERLLTQK